MKTFAAICGLSIILFGTAARGQSGQNYDIYVSNERSDNVTVINGATHKAVVTIPVGKRPRGIHLSPDGKTVYVAVSGTPPITAAFVDYPISGAVPNTTSPTTQTGTITFPTLGTFPLTGTVSGEGITLNYCSAAVIGPCISLTGSTNPTAIQITVTNLTYNETTSGPPPTFTGTLNN